MGISNPANKNDTWWNERTVCIHLNMPLGVARDGPGIGFVPGKVRKRSGNCQAKVRERSGEGMMNFE